MHRPLPLQFSPCVTLMRVNPPSTTIIKTHGDNSQTVTTTARTLWVVCSRSETIHTRIIIIPCHVKGASIEMGRIWQLMAAILLNCIYQSCCLVFSHWRQITKTLLIKIGVLMWQRCTRFQEKKWSSPCCNASAESHCLVWIVGRPVRLFRKRPWNCLHRRQSAQTDRW